MYVGPLNLVQTEYYCFYPIIIIEREAEGPYDTLNVEAGRNWNFRNNNDKIPDCSLAELGLPMCSLAETRCLTDLMLYSQRSYTLGDRGPSRIISKKKFTNA